MFATFLSLLTGIISGTIPAIFTDLATYSPRYGLTLIEFDKELHKECLKAYQELPPHLKPLILYTPEQVFTLKLQKTPQKKCGIGISTPVASFIPVSKNHYFVMKEAMQIKAPKAAAKAIITPKEVVYASISDQVANKSNSINTASINEDLSKSGTRSATKKTSTKGKKKNEVLASI